MGVPVCRWLSLCDRFSRRRPASPQKVLVILLSEMGSLVLAIPMFERIRQKYPHATIHALVFERNRGVLDLIAQVAPSCVFMVRDTSASAMIRDTFAVMRAMRRAKIDTVIDCELFSRVSSIYAYLSGSPVRVGFERHRQEGLYRGSFINRPVLYNPYLHISRQFVNLADAIEARGRPLVKSVSGETVGSGGLPPLEVTPTEIENAGRALKQDFPGVQIDRLVLLYPGGGMLPIRAWPEAYYAEVCRKLTQEGYTVGVVGLAGDRPLAQRVLASCEPARRLDLTGYTRRLRDLVVLFHLADLLITNDGGPGHFAALTPIDTIIFYGPETPALYGPLSSRAHVFFSGLACSPCLTAYNHRNSPCDGNNACLKTISPAVVLEKAMALLKARGAAAPARG